jgi:hypothetical protein
MGEAARGDGMAGNGASVARMERAQSGVSAIRFPRHDPPGYNSVMTMFCANAANSHSPKRRNLAKLAQIAPSVALP